MYNITMIIHIMAGTLALASGLMAIFSAKGKSNHNKAGLVYYYSMLVIGVTGVLVSGFLNPNTFLLAISFFSLYLIHSGKMALNYWRLKTNYKPQFFKDKLPFYLAFIVGGGMIIQPIFLMIEHQVVFVPVLAIFGLIMLTNSIRDIKKFNNPENFVPRNKKWLLQHISMMGGAYIATVTAFAVNNIHLSQSWIVWLAPSAIGTYLITKASKNWSEKLKINK